MKYIRRIFYYYFKPPSSITPINKSAAIIGVLLLFLAGIKVYHNLYDYMDVVYGDEAVYMKIGLNITEHFNRDWGPLYCLWYKFLSLFIHDTINLYYFNFAFIAILATILIYLAFLAMDIHPLVAFYFALCFISSKAVVPMWPRISLFTISILMIGIIIVSRIRKLYMRLLVLCTILLLASYARPELYISFLISIVILLLYYFVDKLYKEKYGVYHLLIFLLFVALLHFIFQFPSNTYNGYPRNLAAFYQHYLINQFSLHKASEYDWIYWKDLHKVIFGDSNSLLSIVIHYPAKFFSHVLLNIRNYTLEIFIKNISVLFPYFLGKNKLFLTGAFTVFGFSIALLFGKNVFNEFKVTLKNHLFYLIMLIIWGIPTVISSTIIYPREHYIMLNYFLFIIPLCLLFNIIANKFKFVKPTSAIIILGILFIPFLSTSKDYNFFLTDRKKNNMCSRKALEHIKNKHLNPNKTYTYFSDIHYFIGFMPNNFKEINTIFDKTEDIPFATILEYNKPDFILVNNCINYSPSLINDNTWKKFLKNPYLYGYKYEFVKDCPYYYLVRNNIYE